MNYRISRRLGRTIKSARVAAGMTQAELAEVINVDPETISRMERGATSPTIDRLAILATALKISLQELICSSSPIASDLVRDLSQSLQVLSPADQDFVISHAKSLAIRLGQSKKNYKK